MYYKHRYNLIRFDLSTSGTAYKLFIKSLYDYVIVKEVTVSDVTVRSYFVGAKDLETNWSNKTSLTYSTDIKGRKLVNEGQNWLAANTGISFTGLLDEYSGAAAAYSLRLLSSSYSGDAIVVRRSSDNATQSIGFVNNELDTASLTTFCSGADGFVTTWFDQSGNGVNATNTTASSQPKIYDSVTGVILENGKAAIDFEASPAYFNTSETSYKTAFTVAKIDVFNNVNYLTWNSSDINAIGYGGININVNGLFFFAGSAFQSLTGEDLNRHLGYFNDTGTETEIAKDGEVETSFTKVKDFSFNTISRDVSTVHFNGKMQELIFYSSTQSSNRSDIETNINNHYSIY